MTLSRCGHKVVIAGSYLVLEGHEGVALAVKPELSLRVSTVPEPKPFDALTATVLEEVGVPISLEVHSDADLDVDGWGLGSSAAYAVALTGAACAEAGLPFSPDEVFPIASRAHRRWQHGLGSGLDVAACCFGGVVVAGGGHSRPRVFRWPKGLTLVLVKASAKADTRSLIKQWFSLPQSKGAVEKRLTADACKQVISCLREGGDLLAALSLLAEEESELSKATGIPLVTGEHKALERALSAIPLQRAPVVKALGAGGGDSIGVFVENGDVSAVLEYLTTSGFQARLAEPTESLRVTSADRPIP